MDLWVILTSSKNYKLFPWLKRRALIVLALLVPSLIMYSISRYHGDESFVPLFQAILGRVQLVVIVNFLVLCLHSSSQIEDENTRGEVYNHSDFIERHGFYGSTSSLTAALISFCKYFLLKPKLRELFVLISWIFAGYGKNHLYTIDFYCRIVLMNNAPHQRRLGSTLS
jgi:hypothetical protein